MNARLANALSVFFVAVIIFLAANGPVSDLISLCGDWFGKDVKRSLNAFIKPIKSNIWRSDGFKLGFPVLISMSILFLTLYKPDNTFKRCLNWLLTAATVLLFGYWIARYYYGSTGEVQTMLWFDFPIMIAAFLLLLFITERKYGAILAGFIVLWFIYPFTKHLFPEWTILYGSFKGFEQTLARIGNDLWLGTDGVFGAPLKVISSEILIFIVFGSVLMATGAGDLLLKIANKATGGLVGGAAHAAVAGSALFGMMSGAAISNVVSTGVMTIPVIKKAGFRPSFAGAVEASASTGGQIMPPVMGVVAFFIVSQTGIAYKFIMVAAIIPALFYYIALFLTVYFEAKRLGISKLRRSTFVHPPGDYAISGLYHPYYRAGVFLIQSTQSACGRILCFLVGFALRLDFIPKFSFMVANNACVSTSRTYGSEHYCRGRGDRYYCGSD